MTFTDCGLLKMKHGILETGFLLSFRRNHESYGNCCVSVTLGNSTFVACTFSGFEARTRSVGLLGCGLADSSHTIFACGAGVRFRFLSVAELHSGVAASRRSSWGRPESPSTEDAFPRCWLNSNTPDGDGAARHWGLLPQNAGQGEGQG